MKINHNFFSDLAFYKAERHLGKTKKNPSVGCVIIKDNTVLSSGVTSLKGRPHAEFNALNNKISFKGASMYVTLEPCTHFGLTPPCTNLIVKKKIKKVYYAFDDPDPRTNRRAISKFRNIFKMKDISVKNKDFYKSYLLNKKKELPLIDAKIAISKDYFTINKKSKWLTSIRARNTGHLLRSRYDCIISTSKSVNKDNSLLNCRIKGLNNLQPDLIIIDRNLKLKKDLKIFRISNKRKTIIFTTSIDKKKKLFFKKKKIRIININKLEDHKDFNLFLRKIFKIGYRRILVESGLVFLSEILKKNLVNNLYVFKSNKNLRSNGLNNCKKNYLKKIKLGKKINVNLGNDNLYKVRIK